MKSRVSMRTNRTRVPGRLAICGAVVCLSFGLVIACSDHRSTSTSPSATPTPKQQLATAVDRMQALSSFHFLLTHENGASTISLGLQMTRADGDFQNPNRFRASVNATFGGIPVAVKVINVADATWMTNPLETGDHYQPLPNGTQAAAILDPNKGILSAARNAQGARLAGAEQVRGVQTQIIEGQIDAAELSALATDAQAGHRVTAQIWIGKRDSLIYRIRLDGPLNDAEPKNIVRQLDVSQFNENVDIEPPSS